MSSSTIVCFCLGFLIGFWVGQMYIGLYVAENKEKVIEGLQKIVDRNKNN